MNARVLMGTSAILLATGWLSGCSGYRHEPVVQADAGNSDRFDGNWTGPLKSRYQLKSMTSPDSLYNAILCKPYRDRITLDVRQGKVLVVLGQAARYRLDTYLDGDGRFYQSFDRASGEGGDPGQDSLLWVAGQFDRSRGTAKGVVGVTPNHFSSGCLGSFEAYLDRGAVPTESGDQPFNTEYRFVELREHN